MRLAIHDQAELVGMIRAGRTTLEVAKHYGVSRERVRQIWTKRTDLRLPGPPAARCLSCGIRRRGADSTGHRSTPEHVAAREARRDARFWKRVDFNGPIPAYRPSLGPCWTFNGAHYPTGYAHSKLMGLHYAHRVAYTLVVGPIPVGLTLDHLCRNPGCVNPAHLEAVTQRENTLRSPIALAAINAAKTHCIHGHEFSVANTEVRRGGRERICRTCRREHGKLASRRRRTKRVAA